MSESLPTDETRLIRPLSPQQSAAIERICRLFEDAWRSGSGCRPGMELEEFVEQAAPSLREELFAELLASGCLESLSIAQNAGVGQKNGAES